MKRRKRTDKSRYKHETTGDYCTCAAYVAEIMCIRNAQFKNKGSLPYKFWNKKPWDWTFKKQLVVARKLIKTYGETALVRAIFSPEAERIFSLNNKRLLPILKKQKILTDEECNRPEKLEVKNNAKHRKKTYGKKSKINRLRSIDLDGKKIEDEI
jgi:hypothetical protein